MITFATNYSRNIRLSDSKYFSQILLEKFTGFIHFSYLISLFVSEFSNWCKLTFMVLMSALFNHINRIVSNGSNKQMFGIYTTRIVTFMANYLSIRNIAKVQNPRGSVGSYMYSLISRSYSAVSIFIKTSSPIPTLGRSVINVFSVFIYECPETLDKCRSFINSFRHAGTIPLRVMGVQL